MRRRLLVLCGWWALCAAPAFSAERPSSGADTSASSAADWPFSVTWMREAADPARSAAARQQELARRFGPAAAPHLDAALERARQIFSTLEAAFFSPTGASSSSWLTRHKIGLPLADYAKSEGSDPKHENFVAAARRILASEPTTKQTVEATSRWLDETADAILASTRAAEAARTTEHGPALDAAVADLRTWAQLARVHSRRTLAAVRYNLFLRGLRLAELVAATYAEKEVVALWRELVLFAQARSAPESELQRAVGQWQAELKLLERNLKELEDQCCPPDEAAMKDKIWMPPGGVDPRTTPGRSG